MTPVWSITAMTANSSRSSTRHPYTLLLFEPKKLSISSFLLSQEAAASLAAFTVHSLETPLRRRKKPFLLFQLKRMALRAPCTEAAFKIFPTIASAASGKPLLPFSSGVRVPCRTKASHDRTLLMACMLYTSIPSPSSQPASHTQ